MLKGQRPEAQQGWWVGLTRRGYGWPRAAAGGATATAAGG